MYKQLDAVAVALVAGGYQRRAAVAVCLVDDGVGGERQPHAVAVKSPSPLMQAAITEAWLTFRFINLSFLGILALVRPHACMVRVGCSHRHAGR